MVASGPQEPRPREPLSRVEREVLEILEKTEQEKPPVTDMMRWKAVSRRRQIRHQIVIAFHGLRARFTPGLVFMLGITLAILAIAMRHGEPMLARVAAGLALVCLTVPFLMVHGRTPTSRTTKTWRGRDITLSSDEPSPVDMLKRWWRTRR